MWAALLVLVLLVGFAGGCGSTGGDGGAGAGGSGGWGTGGIDAPCLDIWVHSGILEEPLRSGLGSARGPRLPFWRDERGLHVAWTQSEKTEGLWWPVHLLVSTFDPASGEALMHRIYDPWPPEVIANVVSVFGVAGAPDGSFAAAIGYGDDAAPDGFAVRMVLGHLDQEGTLNSWVPPWSILEWHPFHVGWDGEAFVFDFRANSSARVLMLRLSPDGSELGAPTEVGGIATIYDDSSSFHTDAQTGSTWLASDMKGGVWLSGHLRGGNPLPGMAPDGFMVVEGQGVPPTSPNSDATAVASDGERALLAWSTNSRMTAYLQLVEGGEEVGEALVLIDSPSNTSQGPALGRKHLARLDDGWWLVGAYGYLGPSDQSDSGIVSFWLADTPTGGIERAGRSVLVGWPPCWPGCDKEWENGFDLRSLAALRYQDELWFGFWDGSGRDDDGIDPYRIVRVGKSCRYPIKFEINHPELMPPD